MNPKVDCFILYTDCDSAIHTVRQFRNYNQVGDIYLLSADSQLPPVPQATILTVDSLNASETIRKISRAASADYCFVYVKDTPLRLSYNTISRFMEIAGETQTEMVYSDHYAIENGQTVKAACIDYQPGAVRNDFDFGSLILYKTDAIKDFVVCFHDSQWLFAAFYELRLFISRRKHDNIFHIKELLYIEEEKDLRKSGEKQFDYVNPNNRNVQIEMEKVFTRHLKYIGAFIDSKHISDVDISQGNFEYEASVIIPVRNRKATIKDAVVSAVSQTADFKFNVIVVDNHSDDGTTDILRELSEQFSNCIHVVPDTSDLGIGGCWNLAVTNERCGRYAVQLDSDDLYSSPHTLQIIVDKFRNEKCAMVIGAYRMCDFKLNTLPPGIIDHKEWTDHNGRNNALRINGLGAPRAFFTPLLRQIGVPNTSYGEDYALGLRFSRSYKIDRIYEELYLCRRWEGNSDASLSRDKVNANNAYKDSLRTIEICARQQLMEKNNEMPDEYTVSQFFRSQLNEWKDADMRYKQLKDVRIKNLDGDDIRLAVQFNPARIVSTSADISKNAVEVRPCFLCPENRPAVQRELTMANCYQLLVNPFPILPMHFTIPLNRHEPQCIFPHYEDMIRMAEKLDELFVFYNGPKCGASAPDHIHLQMGNRGIVPFERDWNSLYRTKMSRIYPELDSQLVKLNELETTADDTGIFLVKYVCPVFAIVTKTTEANVFLFNKLYKSMTLDPDSNGTMKNVLAWTMTSDSDEKKRIVSIVIPRKKHRPLCYYGEGDDKCLVSPGALDMAGLIISPREEDFNKIDLKMAQDIIAECGIDPQMESDILNRLKEKHE